MTTTSSTSSTTSAITTATQQLLTSLDTGSGVDTNTLVASLVKAEFAAKTDALATQTSTLTAQISGVSSLKSAVTGFASALQTLSNGGTLTTQPASSDTSVLTATALPGAKLSGLSKSVTVNQLAEAQTARTTTAVSDRTAVIGSGTFTLTFGAATYNAAGTAMTGFTAGAGTPVTFSVTNASLDDVAAAINGAGAGVTASVVTDANGSAFLSLKGQTGAAQAFTLQVTSKPAGPLAQFNVGPKATGTAIAGEAQDAQLTVDGITVSRASNTVSDLVDGVKLQLAGVSTSPVSLTSATPTSALSDAVTNFVDTYNQVLSTVKGLTDPKTGALKNDPAAQSLLRSLQGLIGTVILTGSNVETNGPTRLSELGVGTNRDGTLKVDSTTLTRALANFPNSVEAMFATVSGSTDGLPAALNSISFRASSTVFGLGASELRYTQSQTDVSAQQDKLSTQSDAETTRLTQQFASMNAKVAAYKSTQTFLKNQIDAWNGKNN